MYNTQVNEISEFERAAPHHFKRLTSQHFAKQTGLSAQLPGTSPCHVLGSYTRKRGPSESLALWCLQLAYPSSPEEHPVRKKLRHLGTLKRQT